MKNNFLLRRLKNVGNIRDAINIFEQVLELDPQSIASRGHLEELKALLAAKVRQRFILGIYQYCTWPDFKFSLVFSSRVSWLPFLWISLVFPILYKTCCLRKYTVLVYVGYFNCYLCRCTLIFLCGMYES